MERAWTGWSMCPILSTTQLNDPSVFRFLTNFVLRNPTSGPSLEVANAARVAIPRAHHLA